MAISARTSQFAGLATDNGLVGSASVGDGQSGDNQFRRFQLTLATAAEGLELETISMTDREIHGRSPGCAALMAEANCRR
jgi:hypothetical protein